jgi:hypothetical protein
MEVVMAEIACNRCHFKVQVQAPPPMAGTNPTWELGPIDVNAPTGCASPPLATCPHLNETIMAAYKAGKLR